MAHVKPHVPKIVRRWVTVGVVVRAFGRFGELKVRPETSFPEERFVGGARLFLWQPPKQEPRANEDEKPKKRERTVSPRECFIASVRWHGGAVLLKLEGVETIEQAEALRGAWLLIPPEERMPLPEDEYYISDLIGMTVNDEAGNRLGLLSDVVQTVAGDFYVVGSRQIPAMKEFVLQIDLANRRMTVRLPEAEG